MDKESMTETVKARVPKRIAARFKRLAKRRVKSVSELARESFVTTLKEDEGKAA